MLAWGVLAFGGVYRWAYIPMLAASAALGLAAIVAGRHGLPRMLIAALCSIAVAVAVQLVPLSKDTIAAISPQALAIHQQRNLLAATGAAHAYTLTIDQQQTTLALAFLTAFSLLLIGSVRLLTRETASRLAAIVAAVGMAVAIIGLIQRTTFNGKIYGWWPMRQGGTPFGPFINRNHFAGWMLMALPLTIGLLGRLISRGLATVPNSRRARLMWFTTTDASKAALVAFGVLLMSMALAMTLSRSGIAAMAGALGFAALLMARRPGSDSQRVFVPLYLVTVLAVAVFWVGLDRIAARFSAPGLIDSAGRRAIWSAAARMVDDFWFSGTGLNTFGVASLYYETPFSGLHVREAHNDYLQVAAEGGVLVGVPIIVAIAALLAGIRRRLGVDQGSIWWVRIGAVTGLLAIAGQSLVEFSLQIPANAALFTVLCAIALHDGGRRLRPDAGTTDTPSTDRLRLAHTATPGAERRMMTDEPIALTFDPPARGPRTDSNVEIELAALDDARRPDNRPTKFPFRAGIYYKDQRRKNVGTGRLALAAIVILLLFFLILLRFAGQGQTLQ